MTKTRRSEKCVSKSLLPLPFYFGVRSKRYRSLYVIRLQLETRRKKVVWCVHARLTPDQESNRFVEKASRVSSHVLLVSANEMQSREQSKCKESRSGIVGRKASVARAARLSAAKKTGWQKGVESVIHLCRCPSHRALISDDGESGIESTRDFSREGERGKEANAKGMHKTRGCRSRVVSRSRKRKGRTRREDASLEIQMSFPRACMPHAGRYETWSCI